MEQQALDFLGLIKSALRNEPYALSDQFHMDQAEELAKKHRILPLFYHGAKKCGVPEQTEQMRRLFAHTVQYAMYSTRQMKLIGQLFAAFDQAEIDYMPLKGTLLKAMYPAPEMRTMGDADILIRTEQYDRIKPIMEQLGYTEKLESDHELVWQKPNSYIELHKRLIPSYNKDYYAYFGDGWQLAKEKTGTRYAMTDEDQLIYLFTHYAKHYRDSGIGLNQILDIWVYRNSKKDLDEAYILQELQKLQLDQFYRNTLDTLAVWFDGKAPTAVTEMITSVILNSGVYGTNEAKILSAALKDAQKSGSTKGVRKRRFLRTVFLPYRHMREKYRVLEKAPVLLPVFWVVRIVTVLLFKRKKLAKANRDYSTASAQNIDAYGQALHLVGLDFNFKE